MSPKYRVVIVEDHALLRAGLNALMLQEPDIEVVGEANNGMDGIRTVGATLPDLVLMDISMPGINGIDAITVIKQRYPAVKVLVLTMHKTDEYIQESFLAGANGYLLKGATQKELREAIRTVLLGKTYLAPDIAEKIITGYLGSNPAPGISTPWDRLTQRERQVLKLIAEGHPNKFIAQYLSLSVKTVEKHRSNLMSKLDIHNASSLTGFAIEKGLLAGSIERQPILRQVKQ